MITFKSILSESSTVKFTIPEKLIPYLDISGNLSNVKKWKSKIILNNNDHGKKIGDFDSVGYILIAINSNNIIPVTRSDEHQIGLELLDELEHKRLIDSEPYISVFSIGNNYIYGQNSTNIKDIEKNIIAYRKFRSYGGNNLPVNVRSGKYDVTIDMDTYIELEGNIDNYIGKFKLENKIAPAGKEIINGFENVAKLYKKYIELQGKKEQFDVIKKFRKAIEDLNTIILLTRIDYNSKLKDAFYNTYKQIEKKLNLTDFNAIGEILFSHNGLKNTIHMALKNNDKDLENIFGSTKKAVEEFNRLGGI